MRQNPKKGFLCIDWPDDDPYLIYGESGDADEQALEFILAPCNFKPNEDYEIDAGCVRDHDEQIDYLSKTINLKILHNESVFDPSMFDDNKIVRYSEITYKAFKTKTPSFQNFLLRNTELDDDTALL